MILVLLVILLRVSGGALYVLRDLNGGVNNTVFTGNTATNSSGGGLYVGRNLSGGINGSEFFNNTSSNVGGAAFVLSTLDGGVNNSVFRGNASGRGGALFLNNVQNGGITNSEFTGNSAITFGGAIFVQTGLADGISDSSFNGNTALTSGGAVYGQVSLAGGISNSSFINNVATNNSGGAIFVNRDLIGGITGSSFTGNSANIGGGAISADSIDFITNSSFKNNSSNLSGGAISILSRNNATVLEINTTGSGVHFSGNKAGGSPNSIHFALNNNATLNVTGSGVLSMYDPLSAIGGNVLTINKTGSSNWLLGGKNNLQGTTNWNINDGILTLTRDSDGNSAWISSSAGDFNLNSGAFLAVVPDTVAGAKIDATNVNLDGKVGVGSDYRYHNKLSLSDFSTTLLTLSNAYTGTGEIAATAGSFSLGQYDYVYDNLHWATPTELVFAVRGYRLNPERNGAYSANMSLRSSLANNTNKSILEHLPIPFNKVKALQEAKYFTDKDEQSSDNSLWANAYNNTVKNDPDGNYAGSSLKTPGLILGTDFQIARRSFMGGAISSVWPDYQQGQLAAHGKDIRFSLYGGNLFKNNLELGYFVSAGFGDFNQKRTSNQDVMNADFNVRNYSVGFSLAKDFVQEGNKIIRPFFSYEYISVNSDGYTENGVSSISASGHKEDISRVKLGAEFRKDSKNGTYVKASLYYQGLDGDITPNIISSMNNNMVYMQGSSVDRNSLGLSLVWGKKVSEKLDFNLGYNGLYGSKSKSNSFDFNLNYKF